MPTTCKLKCKRCKLQVKYLPFGHWVLQNCGKNRHFEYSTQKCIDSRYSQCTKMSNYKKYLAWKNSNINKGTVNSDTATQTKRTTTTIETTTSKEAFMMLN